MTVSKAEKTLQDKGFEVNTKIKTVTDENVKKNRVVKTDPEAGRSIKKGTKITIYKSAGVKTYTLENYVEKNYNDSMSALQGYGLKVTLTDRKSVV